MKSEKISAIVPVHNNERDLPRSISSLMDQTVAPKEIIFVNDASSDGSAKVLDQLPEGKARVLERSAPGPGGYAARNLGVKEANSDWVALLDADDEWKPQHIEASEEIINENPDLELIFQGFEVAYSDRTRVERAPKAGVYSSSDCLKMYAERECFHTNAVVVKKSLYEAVGGFRQDEHARRGADAELWLRLLLASKKTFVSDQVTSTYHRHNSGVVGRRDNMNSIHPVAEFVERLNMSDFHPDDQINLRKLANRKSFSWYMSARSRHLTNRLRLLSSIYWQDLPSQQKRKALFSLFRRI